MLKTLSRAIPSVEEKCLTMVNGASSAHYLLPILTLEAIQHVLINIQRQIQMVTAQQIYTPPRKFVYCLVKRLEIDCLRPWD